MELYDQTNQGSRVRVILTDEELGLPAIDDLCDKYLEWLRVSKECEGRKTRSANRRADQLYDEIIAYKLPPIKLNHAPVQIPQMNGSTNSSVDSESSRPITRALRPRSRTPEIQNQQLPSRQRSRTPEVQQTKRQNTTPSTPSNQRIRAHMKQASDGSSSKANTTSNVLSAAINQQHPSVSATKIRLALRADSAQKRHEEEQRERERLRIDRKAKEERAEAQKKQILEERAINAKKKREERLHHAAEVRKAREEARKLEKLRKEQEVKKAQLHTPVQAQVMQTEECQAQNSIPTPPQPQEQGNQKNDVKALNETFKKPVGNTDNIEIIICDQSNDDQERVQQVAAWARAPYLRDALVKQFTKAHKWEYLRRFKATVPALALPVELEKIFGSSIGTRHIVRTSSAVWSPVHKSMKRSSSMVMTPDKS